ncbi:MAG: hypothetical protein IKW63_03625 [Elusimicrobiaceae bacterium]|nr:hypothetical protein [Elusimicrobiaceae bacterium]
MSFFSFGKGQNAVMSAESNTVKSFDLNIEKILGSWEVYHAIREIIANALDEQILTQSKKLTYSKAATVLGILWIMGAD